MKIIRVVELFAGVGGFHLGLKKANNKKNKYRIVWSNQWEPGEKMQYASRIYLEKFGSKNHKCEDIQKVIENNFNEIPIHDLLVGGFPCQDYSVAKALNQSKGINGKKGVLWWSIHKILKKQGEKSPAYLMLENVNRLLKSPAGQRGRDFAVMLASLSDLGYIVEWRVINAADYGLPQRRKRIFIIGYKKGTDIYNQIINSETISDWIYHDGVVAKAFKVNSIKHEPNVKIIEGDLKEVSENFSFNNSLKSPFENTGIMINRKFYTFSTTPDFKGRKKLLKDFIMDSKIQIPEEFYIKKHDVEKWKTAKGGKSQEKISRKGYRYNYSEGSMAFPDSLEKPSRTIVTGEGGSSPSRFKHVIEPKRGIYRRLIPIELERLNGFPDDHTLYMNNGKTTPDTKRAFIMGNALVVGVVTKLGKSLLSFISHD